MTKCKLLMAICSIALSLPTQTWAAGKWLIASQNETINFGQNITLDIVRPDDQATEIWPDTLKIKLTGNGNSEELLLSAADKSIPQSSTRRTYKALATKQYVGVVRAELLDRPSNRLALITASEDAGAAQPVEALASTQPVKSSGSSPVPAETSSKSPVVLIAQPGDEPALSANEPSYFVVGNNSERGADARFQISFKYRPFDPSGSVADFFPALSNLYFAYTQTTLWDLGGKSSPFRDTSYRPSVFYRWLGSGRGLWPDEYRVGAEHESNGQSGLDSRSLNIAFVRPTWNLDFENGRRLSLSPKFIQYLDKDENSDIQRYRGYADWQVRYGREDGLVLGGLYRLGTAGHSTGQVDISYPLSDRIFARTGAFVHLQLFSGYGETLLDYNQRSDTQLRIGFSISR